MTDSTSAAPRPRFWLFLPLAVPLAALIWAYASTLAEMAHTWATNAQYSHGYLVPGFALVLLWFRRARRPALPLQPTWWGGLILAAGVGMRLFGTYYYYSWFSNISLVPTLAGLCLMVGGWAAWRWACG